MEVTVASSVLDWALESAGLQIEDLLQILDTGSISKFEGPEGQITLNKGQFEKIAKRTGKPRMTLLLPRPPKMRSNERPSFRNPSKDTQWEQESDDEPTNAAYRIQDFLIWAENEVDSDFQLSEKLTPEVAAEKIGAKLGWPPDDLNRRPSKTQMFRMLRLAVEEKGVSVLLRPAGEGRYKGFTLHNKSAPVIFINKDYKNPGLRSFTLAHEVGHLVLGSQNTYCDLGKSQTEVWCNKFAAGLLVPRSGLNRYLESQKRVPATKGELETVRLVSNYFGVSWHAAAISLKAVDFATEDVVQEVANFDEKELRSGFAPGGQTRDVRRLEEFGSNYSEALFRSWENGKLPKHELSRELRLDSNDLSKLRTLIRQGS